MQRVLFNQSSGIFVKNTHVSDNNENENEDSANNINLNINDYTKEDLYNILELENPSSNEIKIKIDSLKNTSFKKKNNIIKFLSDIEEKLATSENITV